MWWFGAIFIQYLSQRQLLGTYFFGGIAGALIYIAAFNFFLYSVWPENQPWHWVLQHLYWQSWLQLPFMCPDYTVHMLFLGQMKIKYIAIITIAIDLLMINSGNAGGHIAHLGGALWGFAYVKMLPGFDPTRFLGIFEKKNFRFSGKPQSRNLRFIKRQAII
ncbi:MAG: hypothetical protein IPF68_06420 [Bacteroidales bacterium]|nr:hypothetical protein [Bacteroidales bacterium]